MWVNADHPAASRLYDQTLYQQAMEFMRVWTRSGLWLRD
jgi:hypothetical protein